MILTHVCGTLSDAAYAGKAVDPLQLDYADAQKHLLRRAAGVTSPCVSHQKRNCAACTMAMSCSRTGTRS